MRTRPVRVEAVAGLALDHIAVVARTLDKGADRVASSLGISPGAGGRHPQMGTWNRLLSLGPDLYLEVIAVDPQAPAPPHPRWFGLDGFDGPPRLAFVLRDPGLACATAHRTHALTRDDLCWTIALPEAGGMLPPLIDWGDTAPPPARLPDSGLRLLALTVPALEGLPPIADQRVRVDAAAGAIGALVATPQGPRSL